MSRLQCQYLRVGIVVTAQFSLNAVANFVDALRLASDDGDRSRPLRCHWNLMSATQVPLRSSCGFQIAPTSTLLFLEEFDSIVAVADELYVVDGDRITSFGGTGAALAAAYLVERHLDAGSAQKAFASCRSIGLVRRRLSNQRRRSPCRAMTSALHGRFS
jgi:transcriptional regulator GlxA family with amidase domain